MTKLMEMKQEVINKYGKDSFEAGYIQHVFSRRSTEMFLRVYKELMGA